MCCRFLKFDLYMFAAEYVLSLYPCVHIIHGILCERFARCCANVLHRVVCCSFNGVHAMM